MFYLDAFFAPPEVRGPALRKAAEISAVMLVLMTLLCWDYGSPDVRGAEAREAMVVSAPAPTRDAYGFYRLVLDVDGNGMRGNRRRPSLVYVPQDAPNLDSLWKGAEVTVLCRETPCKVVEIRQAGRTIVPAATLFEIDPSVPAPAPNERMTRFKARRPGYGAFPGCVWAGFRPSA